MPGGLRPTIVHESFDKALDFKPLDGGIHLALAEVPDMAQVKLELTVEVVAMHAVSRQEAEQDVFGPNIGKVPARRASTFLCHGLP